MNNINALTNWDDSTVDICLRDREQPLEEIMVQVRHTMIALGFHEDSVDEFIRLYE